MKTPIIPGIFPDVTCRKPRADANSGVDPGAGLLRRHIRLFGVRQNRRVRETLLRRALIGVLLIVSLRGPYSEPTARACLNDTSVDDSEKEFRSQYDRPATAPPQRAGLNPWALVALAVGGGLATGSMIVAVGRQRRGAK